MKLTINLSQNPYDITIEKGAFQEVGQWVSGQWNKQKIVIITDSTVNELYGQKFLEQLKHSGFEVFLFQVPAGERSKTMTYVELALDYCAEQGLTRSDGIIALGGGVVGDLAGFVASIYMRGLHFLQIPTTLTAQVDSSIGGKTGVNTDKAKNMIGSFWQPDGVLIDPELLQTLDRRLLIEGMGEVIKCALINDKNLWQRLEQAKNMDDILANHIEAIIYASCQVKAEAVIADELDNGRRLTLNFGHTIGHALESTAGYGTIMHGEAVAIGMVALSKKAEEKGLTAEGLTEQIKQMLIKYELPVSYEEWNEEKLYEAINHDKKARGDKIKLVLVPEIGQSIIHEVQRDEMKEYVRK